MDDIPYINEGDVIDIKQYIKSLALITIDQSDIIMVVNDMLDYGNNYDVDITECIAIHNGLVNHVLSTLCEILLSIGYENNESITDMLKVSMYNYIDHNSIGSMVDLDVLDMNIDKLVNMVTGKLIQKLVKVMGPATAECLFDLTHDAGGITIGDDIWVLYKVLGNNIIMLVKI